MDQSKNFFSNTKDFMKTLKIEPLFFIVIICESLKQVTFAQLFQDKICTQLFNPTHNTSNDYCRNYINDESERKSEIIKEANNYQFYSFLVSSPPTIFIALFIGSWLDKYHNCIRYIYICNIIGFLLEMICLLYNSYFFYTDINWVLLSFVPTGITGTFMVPMLISFSHVSKNHLPEARPIRFAILRLCLFTGSPLGTYLAGVIIDLNPIGNGLQYKNYIGVLITELVLYTIAFIWILIFVKEEKQKCKEKPEESNYENSDGNNNDPNRMILGSSIKLSYRLANLFDFSHVKDLFKTSFKKRSNNGRLKVWLLILTNFIFIWSFVGVANITLFFTEKVFYWDAGYYSTVSALGSTLTTITTITIIPILIKYNVSNEVLGEIGSVAMVICFILKGSIITPIGFYLSFIFGSFSAMPMIAIKSCLSKIVGNDEIGQIFSVLFTVESAVNLASSIIFTPLFNLTLDRYPGFIFHFTAAILFVPLIVFLYLRH